VSKLFYWFGPYCKFDVTQISSIYSSLYFFIISNLYTQRIHFFLCCNGETSFTESISPRPSCCYGATGRGFHQNSPAAPTQSARHQHGNNSSEIPEPASPTHAIFIFSHISSEDEDDVPYFYSHIPHKLEKEKTLGSRWDVGWVTGRRSTTDDFQRPRSD